MKKETVARMTLSYTYLNTPDNLQIVIPNSALSAGKVINYTQLGTQTGTMAMDILQGVKIAPYHVMAGGIITVNKTTAQALGLDYAPFAQMAIELVEVE